KSEKVKWFNDQKGFWFIILDEVSRIFFVHQLQIKYDDFRSLAEAESVEFAIKFDSDRRTKMINITD
ncbi:hypothetical protein PHAVU_007G028900, partial [Phaseolus vulgaris]